jgi:hypothetical protein
VLVRALARRWLWWKRFFRRHTMQAQNRGQAVTEQREQFSRSAKAPSQLIAISVACCGNFTKRGVVLDYGECLRLRNYS